MIFLNTDIKVKIKDSVYDFSCELPEYNHVTVPILYNEDTQKVFVGMNPIYTYFDTPYFPVRLKCYYDEGKRYFYVTGFMSQHKIVLPYETLEMVTRYILPLIDLEPLDKNKYGNNEKSKLAMYGYNVRSGELSDAQRHCILDFVLQHDFMTFLDVKHLLEHHIEYIHNWQAQKKWKRDIEYISLNMENGIYTSGCN